MDHHQECLLAVEAALNVFISRVEALSKRIDALALACAAGADGSRERSVCEGLLEVWRAQEAARQGSPNGAYPMTRAAAEELYDGAAEAPDAVCCVKKAVQ